MADPLSWVNQLFTWLGFGRFNTTSPVLADGATGELQLDQSGNLKVTDVFGPTGRRLVPVDLTVDQDLPGGVCRGLYVGTGGTVVVVAADDTQPQALLNVPNGTRLWLQVKRVKPTSAGTNAASILAIY